MVAYEDRFAEYVYEYEANSYMSFIRRKLPDTLLS